MPDHLSMSVSFKKSTNKSNLNHNNRKFTEKQKEKNNHINYDRTDSNKYFVQKDLKEIYEKEFGAALQKYNQKQKRKDRKIDSYYQHTKDSKKTALQQEMVIQVGDKDDFIIDEHWDLANEVLEDWFKGFEERNPNLKVYNAVIHNDETSPHLHLNFVPVASGYKRGLEKQVSFDRAIKQDDQTLDKKRPFADWREKEVDLIAKRLRERGIERKIVGTNHYKDVNDYKKRKDLEKEIEILNKKVSIKKDQLNVLNTEVTTDKEELDSLRGRYETKKIEVETDEKNILGIPKMKTVEEKTENIILELDRYRKLRKLAKKSIGLQDTLDFKLDYDLVDDWVYMREIKNRAEERNTILSSELDKEKDKNSKLENRVEVLREQIETLVRDYDRIYNSTKDFLKERTDGLQAFKSLFKSWVHDIIENVQETPLKERFKMRVDDDFKELEPKKTEFNIEDVKREANERKKEEKKKKTKNKSKGPKL